MEDISSESINTDILHLLTLKTMVNHLQTVLDEFIHMIARISWLCILALVLTACASTPQPVTPKGAPPPGTELCPGTNGRTFC